MKFKDLKDSCVNCQEIDCINLFEEGDKDNLIGGELFLYANMIHSDIVDDELSEHICSNGLLIRISCYIIAQLNEMFPSEKLVIISNEVVRDLKTSFYLCMSGHYRQSILLLRIVFEYFLYGLYFYSEEARFMKKGSMKDRIEKNYKSWNNGGFKKSEEYLLDIIMKADIIDHEEKKQWKNLFNNLCKFVHTLKESETMRKSKEGNKEINSCYSIVEFNEKKFIEWSSNFRELSFLIIFTLLKLFPSVKNTEAGSEALRFLRRGFENIVTDINNDYLYKMIKMRSRLPK